MKQGFENMASPQLAGLINRAISAHQSGNLSEAEFLYKSVLTQDAKQFDALHMLGVLCAQQGHFEEAECLISRALQVDPVAEAHENHARVLLELKRYEDALRAAEKALSLKPNSVIALNFRGGALLKLDRFELALASFDKAVAVKADHPMTNYNQGEALFELKRLDESLAAYNAALAVAPTYADAWVGRGKIFQEQGRFDDAVAAYGKALSIRPNVFDVLMKQGAAFWSLKRFGEVLECCDRALAVRPDSAEAHYGRGMVLLELQRWDQALASYEKAVALDGMHKYAFSGLAECSLMLCDWARCDKLRDDIRRHVIETTSIVSPFAMLGYLDDDSLQLACAQNYIRDRLIKPLQTLPASAARHSDKIKIAYLSPDFRSHAVAQLTVELFELHDRNRFEVIGVSFGPDDRSEKSSYECHNKAGAQ